MPPERPDFEVLPECWGAVSAFFSVQTQWNHRIDGKLAGLNYSAVVPLLKWQGFDIENFSQLQILERETIRLINKR